MTIHNSTSLLYYQRLFKRLITEDVGADLNEGFDTFVEKKGIFLRDESREYETSR